MIPQIPVLSRIPPTKRRPILILHPALKMSRISHPASISSLCHCDLIWNLFQSKPLNTTPNCRGVRLGQEQAHIFSDTIASNADILWARYAFLDCVTSTKDVCAALEATNIMALLVYIVT